MPSPSEFRPSGSARLLGPILTLSLIGVGAAIYLSPHGSGAIGAVDVAAGRSAVAAPPQPSPTPSATGTAGARVPSASSLSPVVTPTRSRPTSRPAAARVIRPLALARPATRLRTVVRVTHVPVVVHVTASARKPVATTVTIKHCWDFRWQQDAQSVYVANLSDPAGLDGDPGPYNGDGLACTDLGVDPMRAPSKPVGGYVAPAPTPAAKLSLVSPKQNYFGVAQDGLPNDTSMYRKVDADLGKAPSTVEWFAGWDKPFDGASVRNAWSHGALPVMTWMSGPTTNPGAASVNEYSLTKILAGNWDDYLYRFAGDVVRTNLPVVIRFDHEMNGGWFPWAAGQTAWNNSPEKYIAVWRHVWEIFRQVGANDQVIWLWSPSRVDNLRPRAQGISQIADDYPGDDYVDWVGATVYLRSARTASDYTTSFGKTITQIRAVTDKPLFFAEIGAIQTFAGADVTDLKVDWIQNTVGGMLADSSVVGFVWFNNVATTNGVTNDWRYSSSPEAQAAFRQAVNDARFASGVMADGIKPDQ